jgi:hypothetical protein
MATLSVGKSKQVDVNRAEWSSHEAFKPASKSSWKACNVSVREPLYKQRAAHEHF